MKKLGASIITMNHLNFAEDIEILQLSDQIDYLHIDIMDGSFVPRYGIYPEIMEGIAKISDIPMDVHLMVDDVEFSLGQFGYIENIETISFHYFTNEGRIFKLVDQIRNINATPIVAIDLSTPLECVAEIVNSGEIGGVLFMGIHPGVLKQNHRPENIIKRLPKFREMISVPDDFIFQIDGAFNFDTAKMLSSAGINSFVGGSSSIFKNINNDQEKMLRKEKIFSNIKKTKNLITI